MAIVSHAFGQVRLTDVDAEKFYNQVTYGKPKAAATHSVKSGSELYNSYRKNGTVKVTVKSTKGR